MQTRDSLISCALHTDMRNSENSFRKEEMHITVENELIIKKNRGFLQPRFFLQRKEGLNQNATGQREQG